MNKLTIKSEIDNGVLTCTVLFDGNFIVDPNKKDVVTAGYGSPYDLLCLLMPWENPYQRYVSVNNCNCGVAMCSGLTEYKLLDSTEGTFKLSDDTTSWEFTKQNLVEELESLVDYVKTNIPYIISMWFYTSFQDTIDRYNASESEWVENYNEYYDLKKIINFIDFAEKTLLEYK